MDTISIAVFVGIGLAGWLTYRLIQQLFGGKKDQGRSQFSGKNDRPPERRTDILGR